MNFIAALIGLLQALPKLIDLIDRMSKQISVSNYEGWLSSVDKAVADLEASQSLKDKVNAAKRLRDLTASAPSSPS